MKLSIFILSVVLALAACQAAPRENEYVVIAGKDIQKDASWMKVAETLRDKHQDRKSVV